MVVTISPRLVKALNIPQNGVENFRTELTVDTNCPSCNQQMGIEWNYCANCGLKFHVSPGVNESKEKENSTRKIAERFLLLANDYRALTGHILEGEVLQSFINNAASSTLSVSMQRKECRLDEEVGRVWGMGNTP